MRLDIRTHKLIGCRATFARLRAAAPAAAALLEEELKGSRPLAPSHLYLTTPAPLADLYVTTQAQAAKVPTDAPTRGRILEWKPSKLRGVTGLRPGNAGGTLTLLNARRLRKAADLEAALLFELAHVHQLTRNGARERWVTHVRDLAGVAPLPKQRRRALDRELNADDEEAARLARQLAGRLAKRLTAKRVSVPV